MRDIFTFAFLFGGMAVGFITALVLLLLPFAKRYSGRRTLAVAAALPTLAVAGAHGFGFILFLIIATAASFLLILPPLLMPRSVSTHRRPVLAAFMIVAADAWNSYILF